ncbi:hypothetical protein M3193_07960 [Sporosarcina luteola]|uniref:hypothetical protein n=1 Tax=Sporosarcina luteola TaxID=582850 RepID=UPI00203B9485|nr:hypothetical protein [Sporosarcina luteola]MCM3744076.1 hypothetical protein [Sporosarcina luteola]
MTTTKTRENEQAVVMKTKSDGFTKKKNALKAFSKKLPKEAELPCVPNSGGLFGWFDYDVKGSDLNRLTESIQDKMIQQNKVLVRTIKEFNTIYDTFSALDKEYIQGILISLKAAEQANAQAIKGIEGVQANQDEIKQIINQQKQVIQVLKNFKEKIERIEHLGDVDKIFAVFSTIQDKVNVIETIVEAHEQTAADLTGEMKSLLSSQLVIQDNLNQLEEIHDDQIQAVKQLVLHQNENISKVEAISTENKTTIETINKKVAIYGEKLVDLKRLFQDDIQTLSEKVIQDITVLDAKLDSTINEVEKNKTIFENTIKEVNVGIEQQTESISSYVDSELASAKKEITELRQLTGSLSKVLKVTQIISFASIAIICVLVMLIVSGVL